MNFRRLSVALIGLFLPVGGCTIFGDSSPGTVYSAYGRIVHTISIDSLRPGLTDIQVRQTLGSPTSVTRGDFAGFIYEYGTGSGSSAKDPEIQILFADEDGGRVVQITVNPPYTGRTVEGVGLGSSRQQLHVIFGEPNADTVTTSWGSLGNQTFIGDAYLAGDSVAMIYEYDPYASVDRIDLVRLHFH